MSLTQALATAVTGLRVSQQGLSIVAGNVANAETPGYVRKTPAQIATTAGSVGGGVRVDAINRQLDQYVQRQMRIESSGASYADLRAQFYSRLQTVYGVPGGDSTLETLFNNFSAAAQALSTSPDSASARSTMLSTAQVLTQQLHGMTADIQGLRSDAELGLTDSVRKANEAMARIAQINRQLGTATANDATTASLLDQRDAAIDQLAQLMDLKVISNDHNQVTVFTNSGIQLVGTAAATLTFDGRGSMTSTAQWSADPTERTVGTILLKGPNGGDVDLISTHSIRAGEMAAYIEMRDQMLPQAQAQIDEIAAGLARALSDRTTGGAPVSAGAQAGFDIDLSGLLDGNSVRVSYTDNTTGSPRTLTLVRVDDPSALPLANTAKANPNDKVIGLDFSGGMASIVSQISAALGITPLQFSNPAGNVLRILDDGAFNKVDVNAVSATKTITSLTGGSGELPFFLDASKSYSGAITGVGTQAVGFAGRIAVNANLLADPSRLVVYQTSPLTPSGDATRPNFILDHLSAGSLEFSPRSGIGTSVAPFTGSLPSFMRQIISQQGEAAEAAESLKQGQGVVYNSLRERFSSTSAVNIDEEMATLLSLQNSYAANARVLSTVKTMIEALLSM
jgi:flagellar hook-associated protein 1 FlgK